MSNKLIFDINSNSPHVLHILDKENKGKRARRRISTVTSKNLRISIHIDCIHHYKCFKYTYIYYNKVYNY